MHICHRHGREKFATGQGLYCGSYQHKQRLRRGRNNYQPFWVLVSVPAWLVFADTVASRSCLGGSRVVKAALVFGSVAKKGEGDDESARNHTRAFLACNRTVRTR